MKRALIVLGLATVVLFAIARYQVWRTDIGWGRMAHPLMTQQRVDSCDGRQR